MSPGAEARLLQQHPHTPHTVISIPGGYGMVITEHASLMREGAIQRRHSTWLLTAVEQPPEMEYEECEGKGDLDNTSCYPARAASNPYR